MFQMFGSAGEMQKLTGVQMNTVQQIDILIIVGMVPVMAQEGVKYIMSWPNTARILHILDEKPFWWVGPDKIEDPFSARDVRQRKYDQGWR
jgi:hypothetical protein